MGSCTKSFVPPVAVKKSHEMQIHGDTRIDNYHWMRLTDEQKSAKEPDSQTSNVLDYINAERSFTKGSLAHTETLQNNLFDEIVGRIKKDDESVPYKDNGYYYYRRFEKGKEYAIYCRKAGSLDNKEEVILDVNALAEGYDYFAVSGLTVSPNNQWLSYGVDTLSRRFYTIQFKDLLTGKVLDQTIPNTTGSVAWANDNSTVFYTSKNEVTLLSEKIYRHKIGTDYTNDELVYTEDDNSFYIGVYRSKSGEYIIVWNNSTLVSDYHILRADDPDSELVNFSPRGTEHEYSIEHYKDKFYILTNWKAKNNRLMEVSENATVMANWKEVIPHRSDVHLLRLEMFKDHLVLSERRDGLRNLRIMNQRTGGDKLIEFNEPTYTAYISINEEFDTDILRYSYTSMVTPSSTFDYNMDTGERILLKQREVVGLSLIHI